jgi:acetyltransferase-like isoleucine patch superfamily enzyme
MRGRFKNWKKPKIDHGKLTKWHWKVLRPENFKMGKNVDISSFVVIFAHNGVTIEDNVEIGPHCSIMSADTISEKNGPVVLKKGCCIGANSVIMPGVTVGKNTIVGAHSLVNKDLPANIIAFGVPAKMVRKR